MAASWHLSIQNTCHSTYLYTAGFSMCNREVGTEACGEVALVWSPFFLACSAAIDVLTNNEKMAKRLLLQHNAENHIKYLPLGPATWLPSLVTCVQSPEFKWWRKRTNSTICPLTSTHVCTHNTVLIFLKKDSTYETQGRRRITQTHGWMKRLCKVSLACYYL